MGPIVLGHTRAVSYYNPSVVDSIRPDIHRLSAYLLVDRRAWGSAERQGLKHSKTLEKFKDIKIQAGEYLDIKTEKIKKRPG